MRRPHRTDLPVCRYPGMQISPDPGRCMALLVKLPGARRAIEVGVFTGYSALSAALALPDDGRLLACDISDDDTRVGRPYWSQAGVSQQIGLRITPALETLDAQPAAGARRRHGGAAATQHQAARRSAGRHVAADHWRWADAGAKALSGGGRLAGVANVGACQPSTSKAADAQFHGRREPLRCLGLKQGSQFEMGVQINARHPRKPVSICWEEGHASLTKPSSLVRWQ